MAVTSRALKVVGAYALAPALAGKHSSWLLQVGVHIVELPAAYTL